MERQKNKPALVIISFFSIIVLNVALFRYFDSEHALASVKGGIETESEFESENEGSKEDVQYKAKADDGRQTLQARLIDMAGNGQQSEGIPAFLESAAEVLPYREPAVQSFP